eukprot:416227-Rhodomonas_salina.1
MHGDVQHGPVEGSFIELDIEQKIAVHSYAQTSVHALLWKVFELSAEESQESAHVVLQLPSGPCKIPVLDIQPTYQELCEKINSSELKLRECIYIVRSSSHQMKMKGVGRAYYTGKLTECSPYKMKRVGGNWPKVKDPVVVKSWRFTSESFPKIWGVLLVVPVDTSRQPRKSPVAPSMSRKRQADACTVLESENKDLRRKLAAKEESMGELLKELEAARSQSLALAAEKKKLESRVAELEDIGLNDLTYQTGEEAMSFDFESHFRMLECLTSVPLLMLMIAGKKWCFDSKLC